MLAHSSHYGVLLLIFVLAFLSRIFFAFDSNLLIQTLYLLAFIYLAWGIIHHYLEHDLTVKIVVEYILIAGVSMVIVLIALKGGL